MKGEEFKPLLRELTEFYGAKAYTEAAAQVIWRILMPLTAAQGQAVVQSLVEQHGRAPTPALVKQAASPYLRQVEQARQQTAVREIAADACKACGGSGLLLALAKDDPTAEYSFACPYCEAASVRRIRSIPVWSDERKDKFIPVSLKRDSHVGAKELQERHRIPVVRASWAKRLEKHPWALAKLARANKGGLPDYLRDLLKEGHGGVGEGREALERAADAGGREEDSGRARAGDPAADGQAQDLESAPAPDPRQPGVEDERW